MYHYDVTCYMISTSATLHVEKYESWHVTDRHAYRMELHPRKYFDVRWERITSSTITVASHETGQLMLSQSSKSDQKYYERLIFWAHKNPPSANHRSFRKLEIFQPVVAVTASCAKVWLNYSVDSQNLILIIKLRGLDMNRRQMGAGCNFQYTTHNTPMKSFRSNRC